jgi:hypothetical protein
MRRLLLFPTLLLLFCTSLAPFALAEDNQVDTVSKAIPAPEPPSQMLIESFMDRSGEYPDASGGGVHLSWWPWSDETGSNWPDDDAKARIGQLGLTNESVTIYDGQPTRSDALTLQYDELVIDLEGEIHLVRDDTGGVALSMPVTFTPRFNLDNSTVLSIFISEDRAVDHHGRVAQNLVRDMMPEVGFFNAANNTTETTWLIPSSHLLAAGIDFDAQPHGWHITLAFFGSVEGDEGNRLLGLYHTSAPTSWDGVSAGNFFLPIFILLLCAVVASGAVLGSFKREKGMPKIDAQWASIDPPVLQFRLLAGTQPLSLNGCACSEPWVIRGGFKRVKIDAGRHHEFSVRFKNAEDQDCHVSLNVEVEELGSWTQYLRLPSPKEALRSVEGDGDEATAGDGA